MSKYGVHFSATGKNTTVEFYCKYYPGIRLVKLSKVPRKPLSGRPVVGLESECLPSCELKYAAVIYENIKINPNCEKSRSEEEI